MQRCPGYTSQAMLCRANKNCSPTSFLLIKYWTPKRIEQLKQWKNKICTAAISPVQVFWE